MIYFCCDEHRRALVRDSGPVLGVDYNGIDFLEVVDSAAPSNDQRQRVLEVHFVKKLKAGSLTKTNILIAGGERIRGIRAIAAKIGSGADANVLRVTVDKIGDYSTYTLRLVDDVLHAQGEEGGKPPAGFDPFLSAVDFSFKVECPSDFDCRPDELCPSKVRAEPEIDYLAKDYNSFRQAMLDRMSLLMPQWRERNAADAGVALVELLAYVADHLSYRQDVIATEAYLDTARQRVSVRRHAVLVDYAMHDGCNARTWVQIAANANNVVVKRGTQLLTRVDGVAPVVDLDKDPQAQQRIAEAVPERFETVEDIVLFAAHNEMKFYTFGDERCCLPAGATRATLDGDFSETLEKGDVLVFEETAGPVTGETGDADPTHRHAVRLTSVESSRDPLVLDPNDKTKALSLTEIVWHDEDALPFALCISALTTHGMNFAVSVARGNIVLADHGRKFVESLGPVPNASKALATVTGTTGGYCEESEPQPTTPRFAPRLKNGPLTQAAPLPPPRDPNTSASAVFRREMRDVLPAVTLSDSGGGAWHPQRDLLSSEGVLEEFVAEVDDDGRAALRFGDDEYGRRPTPGVEMTATYRAGNGVRGNVGADALAHILTSESGIDSVRNPLPARGGKEPESLEHVRRSAPSAFRVQERAVTADDYAEVAQRHPEVQRAAATFRWTGSWRTVFLTVDRLGGRTVDDDFERKLRFHLERYRMAGHDVEIDGPHFVPLELDLTVCVDPVYFRGDVRAALLHVLGSGIAADEQRGFFHPDNFSFAQPVYLSAVYAAAQKVEGIRFVTIDKFQRLGVDSRQALDDGVLTIGRLEIARLDNDPNFAERGVLRLNLEGGR